MTRALAAMRACEAGESRKLVRDLYVRVCRDSNFGMDAIRAAQFTASVIGIHPLQIWCAMPSFSVMEEIASGKHPICSAPRE